MKNIFRNAESPMQQHKRLLAVVLFLGVLIAVFELSGLREHFNLAFLQQQIAAHHITGLLIFILLFVLGNLIQIPGWLFLAAAVLTLGEVGGGVATYVAACISCAITFLVIRLVGGDALRQLKSRIAKRILSQLDTRPIRSVVLLRVLFQTMPALNYALALSGIRFRQYFIGTLLGLPLPIALYCVFFDYLAMMLKIQGG
jgi:uncharacterized membrane protein YdjX (TVP38/TMEM64 family)